MGTIMVSSKFSKAFEDACENEGKTYNEVLNGFIRDFLFDRARTEFIMGEADKFDEKIEIANRELDNLNPEDPFYLEKSKKLKCKIKAYKMHQRLKKEKMIITRENVKDLDSEE